MFNIPESIKNILQIFKFAGHKAYIVGGAVRDFVIGRTPKDIDICVGCRPEVIKGLMRDAGYDAKMVGQSFGIVTIPGICEIAPFRADVYLNDGSHKPTEIKMVETIEEDLRRRDFRMNALAYDILEDKIVDPFDGQSDILNEKIQCVGNPDLRFKEDALRILRMFRFSAELNFSIEPLAVEFALRNASLLKSISGERIRQEMEKILAAYPMKIQLMVSLGITTHFMPELDHLLDLSQSKVHHIYDGLVHTLKCVDELPNVPILRWAGLFHDIAKGLPGIRGVNKQGEPNDIGHHTAGGPIAEAIMTRLMFSNADKKLVKWLVEMHMRLPESNKSKKAWLKDAALIWKNRDELVGAMAALSLLCKADYEASAKDPGRQAYDEIANMSEMAQSMVLYVGELKINGKTILENQPSLKGKQIGDYLELILREVQSGNWKNESEFLETRIKEGALLPNINRGEVIAL